MGLFDAQYLDEKQIKGFDSYKYSSVDTSPLSNYISHPFWNWIVKFYPLWIAPNALTLAGFLLVMFAFFLVSFLDYDLDANSNFSSPRAIPNWVWLFISILTFTAHTLDGTDGKQARRTGSSGPTGELCNVSLVRLLCILISVQVVFITTHWEKYNTGILYLSWGYDASQFGLAGFYLLTYFVEYEFYKFYVFKSITFAVCFEAGFYVICITSLVMSIYNMYLSYFVDETGRQSSLYEACLPVFSSAVLFAVSIYWAKYSPSNVIDRDPRIYFWTMGTVFSNIACRLIIAQMTQTRAEPFNFLLCMYCAVAFVSLFGHIRAQTELILLRLLAIGITLAHLHYGICLVRQLCDHFNIEPFSLRYLENEKRRR